MAFGRKNTTDPTTADASVDFGLGVEGGYGHPGLTELIEAKDAEATRLSEAAKAAAPSQDQIDAETVATMEGLRHWM